MHSPWSSDYTRTSYQSPWGGSPLFIDSGQKTQQNHIPPLQDTHFLPGWREDIVYISLSIKLLVPLAGIELGIFRLQSQPPIIYHCSLHTSYHLYPLL